jgi:hypothetical protein
MFKPLLLSAVILFVVASCANNEKKEVDSDQKIFPVLPFIQKQVADVDTSLYTILELTIVDSTRTDTVFRNRNEFRMLARDFLELPELTDPKYNQRFKQDVIYDTFLSKIIVVCTPLDPKKEVIQRQEMVLKPETPGKDSEVQNIIIDYIQNSRDSSIQKKMLWNANRNFIITTIKQLPGKEEIVTTKKVVWNDPSNP